MGKTSRTSSRQIIVTKLRQEEIFSMQIGEKRKQSDAIIE